MAATLNIERLASSFVNVNGEKIAVKKILKSKGLVVLEDGNRLEIEKIKSVGRGFFYEGGKSKPSTKPATSGRSSGKEEKAPAAANVNARPAVTIDELEEKGVRFVTVDGEKVGVKGLMRAKKLVVLVNGDKIPVANIARRGRGYFVEESETAPAPRTTGGVRPRNSTKAEKESKHTAIVPKTLRGETVVVNGKREVVERIFTSRNEVKTNKGTLLDVSKIVKKGSKFVYEDEQTSSSKEGKKSRASVKEEKAPKTSGGIRRRSNDDDEFGDLEDEAPKKKPAAKVKAKKVQTIEAFTADLADEIQNQIEAAAKAVIAENFDLKFIAAGGTWNDDVATIELTFGVSSLTAKQIAKMIAEKAAIEFDDEEEDDEEDDSEFDDEEEDDEESEEGDEFEEQIDEAVEALEEAFGKNEKFKGYVENFVLTSEDLGCDEDWSAGETKFEAPNGKVYTLAGADDDGNLILVNTKTKQFARKSVEAVKEMEEV